MIRPAAYISGTRPTTSRTRGWKRKGPMRWPLVVVFLIGSVVPSVGQQSLPAEILAFPPFSIQVIEPQSFDLYDYRVEERQPAAAKKRSDGDPHTAFVIKKHLGASVGWDNGILHGSVGMYVTMAELGRWNFGAPTVELGLGRYPFYDEKRQRAMVSSDVTVLISIASVPYRLGYIPSWGLHWYLNLEQVVDMHSNLAGSQFGLTFSKK
jgi:hypothetical protein